MKRRRLYYLRVNGEQVACSDLQANKQSLLDVVRGVVA